MHVQKGKFLACEGRIFPPSQNLEEQILHIFRFILVAHPQLKCEASFVQYQSLLFEGKRV